MLRVDRCPDARPPPRTKEYAARTAANSLRSFLPAAPSSAPKTLADLRALLDIARHDSDVERAYQAIVDRCVAESGFVSAELLRADDTRTWTLCARAGVGSNLGVGAAQVLEPGNVVRQAFESGEHRWAESTLVMPLVVGIGSWGAVALTRGPEEITEDALERVGMIAEAGALVIGYYESRARLAVSGNTDPLTGLPHRRPSVDGTGARDRSCQA